VKQYYKGDEKQGSDENGGRANLKTGSIVSVEAEDTGGAAHIARRLAS
jgi:hypothetical protein